MPRTASAINRRRSTYSAAAAVQNGVAKKRRFDRLDVSDVIVAKNIKTKADLLRLANERNNEGKRDLPLYSLRRSELLLYLNKYSGASDDLKGLILSHMYKDNITDVVISDKLITIRGSFLLPSHGIRKRNNISQRMRLKSRLVIALRCQSKKTDSSLTDYVDPQYFDNVVVQCTRKFGGYSLVPSESENVPAFKTPSLENGICFRKSCRAAERYLHKVSKINI